MKRKYLQAPVLLMALNVLLATSPVPSRAQPDTPTQKHVVQQKQAVTAFKIEHVRAEIMAMWLQLMAMPTAKPNAKEDRGESSEIPGLESIVPNPKTNEIWATGTPESITKLRDLLSFLDQPVRSVEVKVQFVEVDKTKIVDLEVADDAAQSRKTFPAQSGFEDKLKALVRFGQAKVIHASQVTTPNNSKAIVSSPANAIAPELEWSVTPTIQNDDTVTLFFVPQTLSKYSTVFYTSVSNVRAGEILVLNIKNLGTEQREMLAVLSTHILEQ